MSYDSISGSDGREDTTRMRYSDRTLTLILGEMEAFHKKMTHVLGTTDVCEELRMMLNELQSGPLEILFEGIYGSGKSTLINSLLGREIIPTPFSPEGAVPTRIRMEEREGISFVRENGRKCEMPLTKESWYKLQEMYAANELNSEEVIFRVANDNMHNGILSLSEPNYSTNRIEERRRQALAVVYVLHPHWNFPYDLQDFYSGKGLQNLFVVVSRMDTVQESDIPNIKRYVREKLKNVFTKPDSSFDEELFNQRVFYVNGHGAMLSRTGKSLKIMGMEVQIPIEVTGYPEFEAALENYIFQSPLIQTHLYSVLKYMCKLYDLAVNTSESAYIRIARSHLDNAYLLSLGNPLTDHTIKEIANLQQ